MVPRRVREVERDVVGVQLGMRRIAEVGQVEVEDLANVHRATLPGIVSAVDLSTVKDISIVVAGIATLAGFLAAITEYARQGHARRAEHFVELRRRFLDTPSFQPILRLLDADDPGLAEIPLQDRRNFLGFLEEVQLMVDSHLIRPDVARTMFGRYVALADASRNLWSGLDRQDPYWRVFRRMVSAQRTMRGGDDRPLRF